MLVSKCYVAALSLVCVLKRGNEGLVMHSSLVTNRTQLGVTITLVHVGILVKIPVSSISNKSF